MICPPAASGVSFGFTGVQYAPCAIPIVPLGVGIFPQAVNIGADVFNIGPTGLPLPCIYASDCLHNHRTICSEWYAIWCGTKSKLTCKFCGGCECRSPPLAGLGLCLLACPTLSLLTHTCIEAEKPCVAVIKLSVERELSKRES